MGLDVGVDADDDRNDLGQTGSLRSSHALVRTKGPVREELRDGRTVTGHADAANAGGQAPDQASHTPTGPGPTAPDGQAGQRHQSQSVDESHPRRSTTDHQVHVDPHSQSRKQRLGQRLDSTTQIAIVEHSTPVDLRPYEPEVDFESVIAATLPVSGPLAAKSHPVSKNRAQGTLVGLD